MTQAVQQPELDDPKLSSSQPAKPSESVLDATKHHRHDLDGLRAFAIALVVAYHVWVGRVSGGVDVFLLLSAYFMTGSLVRKAEGGKFGLGTYWVNRFWRLVPVAALTIGGVLALTYFFFPASAWEGIWAQSWASLFYWQNWELAATSVDYYARGADVVSPLLHFWSLSVQGQVFVLWPLILLACWGLARLLRVPLRAVALGAFAAIFVASLAYSIWVTSANQTYAYYDTFARLWEFALGSLVAVIPLPKALPRIGAEIVGWVGVLALLVCGMVLDVSGGFPGYLALWPSLAAVAIIVAGATPRTSFGAFLGSRPMRWIGKIAYPLYLVHWPILVAVMVATGVDRPDFATGTAIIGASIALAVLIRYIVERPLQLIRFKPRTAWAGALALAFMACLVIVPLTQWRAAEQDKAANLAASTDHPGAETLDVLLSQPPADVTLIPLGSQLGDEWGTLEEECSEDNRPDGIEAGKDCAQTIVDPAAPTLLVVGDSHAQQWMAALAPIADDNNYNVVAVLRGGCAFALEEYDGGESTGCGQWRAEVISYIQQTQPAVVATVGTRSIADSSDERELEGLVSTLDAIRGSAGQIILLRDTPRHDENMYECVQSNLEDLDECTTPMEDVLASTNPIAGLSSDTVHVVDMSPYFCPDGQCVGVLGNVIVYIDDNHIGRTFMETLSNPLEHTLREVGMQW